MVWTQADTVKRAEIVKAISRSYPAFRRDPERCQIAFLPLPFYPSGQLVKLSARDIPGSIQWYTLLPEETVAMSDGIAAVHHCNAAGPLVLNDATVLAYIKYRYYFETGARLFEARVKRSAVGYTGKIWLFEKKNFFEIDINMSPRGLLVELERLEMADVPDFAPGDFGI